MLVGITDLLALVLRLTEIGVVMDLLLIPGLSTAILAQETALRMVTGSTILIALLVDIVRYFLLV